MLYPRRLSLLAITALLTLSGCESADSGAKNDESKKAALTTDIQKGSYLIGYNQVAQLLEQTQQVVDPDAFAQGVNDFISGTTPQVPEAEMQTYFTAIQQAIAEKGAAAAAAQEGEAEAFREAFAAQDGVTTLPSGLMYEVITEGSGDKPTAEDTVVTHYHGTLINGDVFDSSVDRGEPATFPVSGVIRGWTEALQLMNVGSKWKLVIPSDLAYGERGAGGAIGPNETLVFEVELLEIKQEDS